MAIISPNLEKLVQLIEGLLSSDLQTREKSEKEFNTSWVEGAPNVLLPSLCQLLKPQFPTEVRSFAAIMFRRLSFKPYSSETQKKVQGIIWNILDDNAKLSCQHSLLECLLNEKEALVKNKIGDAVAELCRILLLSKKEWPELLPTLIQQAQKGEEADHICVLHIITALPELISKVDANSLYQLLANNLNPNLSSDLKTKSIQTFVSIYNFDAKLGKQISGPALGLMWQTIKSIEVDDYNHEKCITAMIELAGHNAKLFRSIIEDIFQCAIVIIGNKDMDDDIRHSYIEWIITISELSPGLIKKLALLPNFIFTLFQMMAEVPEDSNWTELSESDIQDDDNENYAVAEQAIDRLACGVGGKVVVPIFFSIIPNLIASQRWNERHAGLIAISCVAEGCYDELLPRLDQVLSLVFPKCNDEHPRVRYAACHALGQLSTDFNNIIQVKYHKEYLSTLCSILVQDSCPRVQAHAAAALVNFCQDCDLDILNPYINDIMNALMFLMKSPRMDVQEQSIGTISALADVIGSKFGPFYNTIVPCLIEAVKVPEDPNFKYFRCKAIESLTLIIVSVGKEYFERYAQEVVSILMSFQNTPMSDDNPLLEYLPSAWVRICKVLEQDFASLLPSVLPPLLAKAKIEPDVALLDNDEDESEEYSEGWDFVTLHGKKIGIHTALLDDKSSAIDSLNCYAKILGHSFAPFSIEILEFNLPLLKFDYHDGVKISAAAIIPSLLSCLHDAHYSDLTALWLTKVSTEILSSINRLPEPEVIAHTLACFHDCVSIGGKDFIPDNIIMCLMSEMMKQLQGLQKHVIGQNPQAEDDEEGYEEDDYEKDEDDQSFAENVFSEITRCLHVMFSLRQADMLYYLNDCFIPFYSHILSIPNSSITFRHNAICFMDDVIEYGGTDAWNYHQVFFPALLKSLVDDDADIRQAAAYGVGVCAKVQDHRYFSYCNDALPTLISLISVQTAENKEKYELAIENAMSAIAKIALKYSQQMDLSSVVPIWLSALPVKEDEDELEFVYSFFVFLIESCHPFIMSNPSKVAEIGLQCISVLTSKNRNDLVVSIGRALSNNPSTVEYMK